MRSRLRSLRLAGLVLLALVVSACQLVAPDVEDAPLNSLDPQGPFARQIDDLFWPVFWIATGVFFFVQLAIIVAAIFFRDRPGRKEPKQIHGNAKLEVIWTVIPALILATIAVPTVRTVFDLTECSPDAMRVEVIGHQWWFEFRYSNLEGIPDGVEIETANTMVIPADEEVCALMTSEDVVHNFWVPKLNGKRYLVPGQETILRLQADEPGTYYAHCAEFCGLSHSLMRAQVEAVPRAEFDAWLARQLEPAAVPDEGTPEFEGLQVFQNAGCVQCHAIDFEDNDQNITDNVLPRDAFNGPNLTHFADQYRTHFAGAALPEHGEDYDTALKRWLADPPSVKPGSFMPDLGLTEAEIDDLIAWLKTLE
ncbi:MAG TPA: cytochrome c oxidase subunit II [Acidimicrobiia bacterium]|nr:cytochrome c oxidase subunit II [Acidimicrobiia bacterium]